MLQILFLFLFTRPSHSALTNGAVWHDTHGHQIEAHGGMILKIGGLFHWYGSTKKEPGCQAGCSFGVNVYTSVDLLSWTYGGRVFNASDIVVPRTLISYVAPLRIERPKVIYNDYTSVYVLVFHCEDAPYKTGLRGVASSSSPGGPFKWVGAEHPNELFSMDMTEYVDPNDPGHPKQAYHIRTARHNPNHFIGENPQWLVGSKLSSDYLSTSPGTVCFNTSTSTEGQAIIFHKDAYYIFGSHLTGLGANPARLLRCKAKILADCCTVPGAPTRWEDLGNPAVGGAMTPDGFGPNTTFNAQSTFVLPLEQKNKTDVDLIALWMGDRWNPNPSVAPGGEHNATYVWLNIFANAVMPELHFAWETVVVPGIRQLSTTQVVV